MPEFTEIIFGAGLSPNTPPKIINTLRYLMCHLDEKPHDYEFNADINIGHIFHCSSTSKNFGVDFCHKEMRYDVELASWKVSFRSTTNNYDFRIQKFIEWIYPYVIKGSGRKNIFAYVLHESQEYPETFYINTEFHTEFGMITEIN